MNIRKQVKNIVIASGAVGGQPQTAEIRLDAAYQKCTGIVAYQVSSAFTCQIGLKNAAGDWIVDLVHFDELKGNTNVAPADRYIPVNLQAGDDYKIVVTPRSTLTAAEEIDFVFKLEK